MHSVLGSYFVEQFAWGLISPAKIQHVMSLAKQDLIAMANGTLNFSEVEALVSIGAARDATCNSLRDLQRNLAEGSAGLRLHTSDEVAVVSLGYSGFPTEIVAARSASCTIPTQANVERGFLGILVK